MLEKRCAILTIADSRDDYYSQRHHMVMEQLENIKWLNDYADCYVSPVLRRDGEVKAAIEEAKRHNPQALIIHIPIWADPVFAETIAVTMDLPILLLGNRDPATSSMVGLLGAAGALDQISRAHIRVMRKGTVDDGRIKAFIDGAAAAEMLRGKKMLRFGDCALGIRTAAPDAMRWLKDFGVGVQGVDESKIVEAAKQVDAEAVTHCRKWLESDLGGITFGDGFTEEVLERQIRAYLGTKKLLEEYSADFIGIKCQPDLSDHYANQCLSHMLMNATFDDQGAKPIVSCSCESDANGALTMYLMGQISNAPASLMDVRSIDEEQGLWLLANCGAMPLDHYACKENGCPNAKILRHTFGKSGAAACTGELKTGAVTMARICVKNDRHWMAVVRGESVAMTPDIRKKSPMQFPTAYIKTAPLDGFLDQYDSNHIHIVFGDISESLRQFCNVVGIECKVW